MEFENKSYSFHFLVKKREKWNEYELIVPLFKEKEREEE
jgi:hypothetical protein